MGAKLAKPNPPDENKAKIDAEVALQGLESEAGEWKLKCELGVKSGDTLGYELAGEKLQNFEKRLIVQTEENAPQDAISKAVDDLFSGDWKSLTKLCLNQLASFFGGGEPLPAETAFNEVFSKGYLVYEYSNLVQYSVMVRRTNCSSVGTALKDSRCTIMACVCSGLVDFAKVDPQATIYNVQKSQPDITPDELIELISSIEKSLVMAAKLAKLKKQLEDGSLDIDAGTKTRSFQPRIMLSAMNSTPANPKDEEINEINRKLDSIKRIKEDLQTTNTSPPNEHIHPKKKKNRVIRFARIGKKIRH